MAREVTYERWLAENGLKDNSFMMAVVQCRQPRRPSKVQQRLSDEKMQEALNRGSQYKAEYNALVEAGEIIDPSRKSWRDLGGDPKSKTLDEYLNAATYGKSTDTYSYDAIIRCATKYWHKVNGKAPQ